ADLAATPTVEDELPGESALDIGQHVRNEDAGAFKGGFSVADRWVCHDVSAQLNSSSGAALDFAHGWSLSENARFDNRKRRGGGDHTDPASNKAHLNDFGR